MVVSFWIFLDQICPKLIKLNQTLSNLIKLDQIGFLTNQKMLLLKVVTFTERIEMTVLFLISLDQIYQKWIKLDQTFWPETVFWQ